MAAVYGDISGSRLGGMLVPCTWCKDNSVKRPSVIGALKDPINSFTGHELSTCERYFVVLGHCYKGQMS